QTFLVTMMPRTWQLQLEWMLIRCALLVQAEIIPHWESSLCLKQGQKSRVNDMELSFVLVKSKMGHEMDVMNDILKIDGVKEATGTFGQFDIFVKVQANTRSELDKIITKKIRMVSNVLSTTTLPALPG